MLGTECNPECRYGEEWVTMTVPLKVSVTGGDSGMLCSSQEVLWVYDLTKYL